MSEHLKKQILSFLRETLESKQSLERRLGELSEQEKDCKKTLDFIDLHDSLVADLDFKTQQLVQTANHLNTANTQIAELKEELRNKNLLWEKQQSHIESLKSENHILFDHRKDACLLRQQVQIQKGRILDLEGVVKDRDETIKQQQESLSEIATDCHHLREDNRQLAALEEQIKNIKLAIGQ